MSSVAKALADADRSYAACKANVGTATQAMLAGGQSGTMSRGPDLANAAEQYRHFAGWVYAAIRPIAQKIAGQPILVGRHGKPGRRSSSKGFTNVEPLGNHPLLTLLADPNQLMVGWSLIYNTVASLELSGRALWWLPQQKEILPIPTHWITKLQGSTSYEGFVIRPPGVGTEFTLPADQCCYFSYPDPSDPHGALSPLMAAAGAVDADESITLSQSTMFRRGVHPSHAIIVGKAPHPDMPGGMRPHLSAAQQRQIIAAISKRYAGATNFNEPFIIDGMIEDIKRLSNSPAEMDWLTSSKLTKEKILQIYGVNEIIIGAKDGNRASALAAEEHFCGYTINPKIELISQCLTEWLRPQFGDDLVVWIEPCVPHDEEMLLKRATLLASHKAIELNELREMLGLPADRAFAGVIAGADGKTNSVDAAVMKLFEQLAAGKAASGHADEVIGVVKHLLPTLKV